MYAILTDTMVAQRRLLRAAVAVVLLATALSACEARPAGPVIQLGGVEVRVEVAEDDDARSRGLQEHKPLKPGEGMLFVFKDAAIRTFAMKDVSFPIDVLFIGLDSTVSAIEPLSPGDGLPVVSPGPCVYVVELPQGWAAEQGIVVGSEFVRPE